MLSLKEKIRKTDISFSNYYAHDYYLQLNITPDQVLFIYYLIYFNKYSNNIEILFSFRSEVNARAIIYFLKLDIKV